MEPVDAARSLRSRTQLEEGGRTSRGIDRALDDGSLIRVSPGRYARGDIWRDEFGEGRHLLRVAGTFADLRSDAVACLTSAAVLHRLPLWRLEPARVHLAGLRLNGRTTGSLTVARHRAAIPRGDVVEIAGIPCTSLPRTVADLIRHLDPARGLVVADAAMRARAFDPVTREYDGDKAEAFRFAVGARLRSGARGVKHARRTLELADGRAESPGESVSRMLLVQIGFAVPRIQVEVPSPRGRPYRVDFGLDDVDAWGEYDGEVKYRDPRMRAVDEVGLDVLLAEKEREDWIRGTTNRRYVRWGSAHLTEAALARRLAAFHIRPPH